MKQAILELIAAHDGEFNWYSLDRALLGKIGTVSGMMQSLKDLKSEGMITEEQVEGYPSMPRYRITDRGKQAIT